MGIRWDADLKRWLNKDSDPCGSPEDLQRDMKMIEDAARMGSPECMYIAGMLHSRGLSEDDRDSESEYWFRRAAEKGVPEAWTSLGTMYYTGVGVRKSIPKAIRLYMKGAIEGDDDAFCKLGIMYEDGTGIRKSVDVAERCYRMGAMNGNMDCMYFLGTILRERSEDDPSDMYEAVHWFKKAASRGESASCLELGLHYACDLEDPDYGEGLKWLSKGSELGDADCKYLLG